MLLKLPVPSFEHVFFCKKSSDRALYDNGVCMAIIDSTGLTMEGIYRKNGQNSKVTELLKDFYKGLNRSNLPKYIECLCN